MVKALEFKADNLSSNLMRTIKLFVCLVIAYSSMIQVLINPDIPPPAVAVEITRQSCRNLKSKKTEGGEYNLLVEVSVNSKEENS